MCEGGRSLDDLMDVYDLLSFLRLYGMEHPYEERKIGRDVSQCGITVSTAYTPDEGYETALLDRSGTYPVERYRDVADAIMGHEKWLKFAHTADGARITILGWQNFLDNEEVVLRA
jgi:hypothetical protein